MAEDLHQLDEWFGRILQGLTPAERRNAALKLGRELRKANTRRIAANIDPDGEPFAPRIPRKDRRGRLRARQPGKMFKGLRKLKQWKIDASADGVAIAPANGLIDRLASVSQFGDTVTVGRLRNGQRIRAKYAERHLLGFSEEDRRLALDIAAELVSR